MADQLAAGDAAAGIDEAGQPDDQGSGYEPARSADRSDTDGDAPWWVRLGIGALGLLVLAGSAIVAPSPPALAETTIGNPIPVGSGPRGVAANSVTHRVYVSNFNDDTITVIDSAAGTVVGGPIEVGGHPDGVAVNPLTNRIYVVNQGESSVSVIDGATNTLIRPDIDVGLTPRGIAVNPNTNKIYVANAGSSTVSVIDGATNTPIGDPIAVSATPWGVAVNPATNRVYVTCSGGGNVIEIDGVSNRVRGAVAVGTAPHGVAANPTTNKIYVAVSGGDSLAVIDGAAFKDATLVNGVAKHPEVVGVNPATNRVYVAGTGDGVMRLVDGATNTPASAVIKVGGSPEAVAIDPTTNLIDVASTDLTSLLVIGIPVTIGGPLGTPPGAAVSLTWSSLLLPNGSDLFGLYQPGAPNTAPLTRRFTNGTGQPGGPGVEAGSVTLRTVSNQAPGPYEIRLVSGTSGGTLARLLVSVPSAVDDSYTVDGTTELIVPAPGVLANDSDTDSKTLQAVLVTKPLHGAAVLKPDGSFAYKADEVFTGSDTFTYEVVDQTGLASAATVTVTVSLPPTAADDTYTVVAGNVLTVAAPGVLANDADPDSPSIQAVIGKSAANGDLALQPTGAFTYKPNDGFTGTDVFTYRAKDQASFSQIATVTITVTAAAPLPPVGVNDTYAVASGTVLTVPAPGVLTNDTSANKAPLQAVPATNPSHGTLALRPDGGFSYTPTSGFAGTDGFTYRASDGTSQSQPTTVTITVNQPSPQSDCAPRPPVKVTQSVGGGKLTVHVQTTPLNTRQPNALRSLRFGTLQNANVTVGSQRVASGQVVAAPGNAFGLDFVVERVAPGQAVTVPFTAADDCGAWQTFVGGGPSAGF